MASPRSTHAHGRDGAEGAPSQAPPGETCGVPGEPVIGRRTIILALIGLSLGLIVGGSLGFAVYHGQIPWRAVAPMVAGGPAVPIVLGAAVCAAMLALVGGLVGTMREPREAPAPGDHGGHGGHGEPRPTTAELIARWLPALGGVMLAAAFIISLVHITTLGVGRGTPSPQTNRMHWHQKNATRIGTTDHRDTAALALATAYPATTPANAPRVVLRVPADWRLALAATPLVARPTDAAIVVDDLHGTEGVRARDLIESLASVAAPPVEILASGDPAVVAKTFDRRRADALGAASPVVLIVASDADPAWALPAGAYAARTGAAVLFVEHDRVPAATTSALERRGGAARMILFGPEGIISSQVADELARHGWTRRLAGDTPIAAAVSFAELRDEAQDIGWGHDGRGARRFGSHATILVAADRWRDGIAAAHLARRGKAGPILLVEGSRLPPAVDVHLWRLRPVFGETPAEGPFNHVWVVGSLAAIPYGVQAWADYSQEIEQYMTLGPSAVSGFEALGIAWIALSLACAAWIAVNAWRRLPGVLPAMKAAWAVFALLLGPIALWLYFRSYHRRPRRSEHGLMTFERPPVDQAVSATVMMFGFDMLAMCLAAFALALFGFPIVPSDGPLFWLGTSMFLMMVFMFFAALVVVMLVFHGPMTQHERGVGYLRALWVGLPLMTATMLVESIGMMPTMWWQQMYFLPAMQMPTEDDITMWVTLYVAVAVGFLVVLPFNHALVKRGRKMGSM